MTALALVALVLGVRAQPPDSGAVDTEPAQPPPTEQASEAGEKGVVVTTESQTLTVQPIDQPIVPPVLTQDAQPVYPEGAREAGLEGDVVVRLTVDPSGAVVDAELVRGAAALLDLASLDAARRLRFEPATQGGEPVGVQLDYRFHFSLGVGDQSDLPIPGTLRGVVEDSEGLSVPGATVRVQRADGEGDTVVLDARPDGSFQVPFMASGMYRVTVTHAGFADATYDVEIRVGESLDASFVLMPTSSYEMVVVGERRTWREVRRGEVKAETGTVTGTYTLTRRDIEATPGALEDVSRAVHALPGVVSDGDMLATFNVRGGDADDVIFLLDRVPLDSPFHLAGFNSIFNPDMIREVRFYAGAAPADVPAATSAVMAVESWDGTPTQDSRGLDGALDLSASSARAFIQGPIANSDRSTMAVAARRTYLEGYFQVMKWANLIDTAFAAPEFNELSARYAFRPDASQRVIVTLLRTGDSLALVNSGDDSAINVEGALELDNKLYMASADYLLAPSDELQWQSTVAWTTDRSYLRRDLGGEQERTFITHKAYLRSDLTWSPGAHTVQGGVDASMRQTVAEGVVDDTRALPTWHTGPLMDMETDTVRLAPVDPYEEASVYLQESWEGPINVRLGGRATWTGATDELLLSPRGGLSLPLSTGTIPKISAGLYHRTPRDPIALSPVLGTPENIHSERAKHLVFGVDQGFPLPGEESGGLVRVEVYEVWLTDLLVNADTQAEMDAGRGYASTGTGTNRGVDFLVAARTGRVNTMLSYSLLEALRFNPLNTQFSQNYAPGQDQRHTVSASADYQITPKWRGTTRYSFHTGRPVSSVAADGDETAALVGLNDQRMGKFHSVDVRAEWREARRTHRLSVYVEVLNVLNTKSAFVPIATVEDGELTESMFYHLPARPFLGVRVDF